MRFPLSLCLGLLLLTPVAGRSDEALLCVQGKSFVPGHEFVETRQLRFTADGPPPGDLLRLLVSRGVREKLWPELAPDQVQVMPFDAAICGSEPMAELTLRYTADDLAAFELERNRGPGDQPRLRGVAQNAEAKPADARSAPPGAPANAQRHDWVRLYFATSRRATGADNATQAFGKERSDRISFGAVEVSIPFDHRWARLESPSLLRLEWDAYPQRHVVLAPALTRLQAKGNR